MKSCVDACLACHDACMEITAKLRMQGPGDEGQIGALLDCAELCRLTASLVGRDSPLHAMAAALCAESCRRAARDCERINDAAVRRVADICRRTADRCRRIAAGALAVV
jgi:hypothetical protein